MKSLVKKVLPRPWTDKIVVFRNLSGKEKLALLFGQSEWEKSAMYNGLAEWEERDFLNHSPQFIKEKVFLHHGVQGAPWVETGTFMGTTTAFLLEHYPKVYSIEPEPKLYEDVVRRFSGSPVELFNDISERVFPELLPKLGGSINFWLDGHYSAGVTFKGPKDCPVEEELAAISENLDHFEKVSILIDDVRCFLGELEEYKDYPTLDYIVDWARRYGFNWRIEHDIFIMKKNS